jgi:hypothetical protein
MKTFPLAIRIRLAHARAGSIILTREGTSGPDQNRSPEIVRRLGWQIRTGRTRSRATRELNTPEMWRGLEKFDGHECLAVVGSDESGNAAEGVFVGLNVGNDELLGSKNVG